MTEKEFLELTDRERDALVAFQVMGFIVSRDTVWKEVYDQPDNLVETNTDKTLRRTLQSYTTEISVAWEVVEKIKSINKNEIFRLDWDTDYNIWECGFAYDPVEYPIETLWNGSPVENKSAPLAICIASLRAKGIIT